MEKEHFEILLEDMQGKFELVMEGLEALNKKVDDHRAENQERFDMLAYMIEKLQEKNVEFEGRFDKLEGRFDKLEGRFDKLEGRFDKLEGRFDKLDADFAAHRANTEIHAGYTVNETSQGHAYR